MKYLRKRVLGIIIEFMFVSDNLEDFMRQIWLFILITHSEKRDTS